MGDNIFLGDRNGVRTPMQWSPDRNAGFSRADPQRLYLPPIMDPIYGYEAVNVEAQAREPSLAAELDAPHARGAQDQPRVRPRHAARSCSPATARSSPTCASTATTRSCASPTCRARRSRSSSTSSRLQGPRAGRAARPHRLPADRRAALPADAAGARLLLVPPRRPTSRCRAGTQEGVAPRGPAGAGAVRRLDQPLPRPRRAVAHRHGRARRAQQLETRHCCRASSQAQRWYARQGRADRRARALADHALWEDGRHQLAAARCSSSTARRSRRRYFVPLALAWEDRDEERMRSLAPAAVAKVRQQASVGVLGDAFADEAFCRARRARRSARGRDAADGATARLRFRPTAAFARARRRRHRRAAGAAGRRRTSSNTVVTLGERLFLKGYRRLRAGINPELEIGRFLTEVARFPHCVPVAGARRVRRRRRHASCTLALLQAYVPNQGDGWTYTLDYLRALPRASCATRDERRRRRRARRLPGAGADARPAHRRAAPGARARAPATRRSTPSR